MGTGFAKKKKQARLMEQQLSQMQTALEQTEVTGTAGNGLVTIVLGGNHELKRITIKPECVDRDDIEGLQDLIRAAYRDALEKLTAQTTKQFGGGPLPSFPF